MRPSITLGKNTSRQLSNITTRTGLRRGTVARFALCLSLGDPSVPKRNIHGTGGKPIPLSEVFGPHGGIMGAMMAERAGTDGMTVTEAASLHANRGIVLLHQRVAELEDFGRLLA